MKGADTKHLAAALFHCTCSKIKPHSPSLIIRTGSRTSRLHVKTWLWFLQDPEQLQENANQILTAIIQGMRKEEPSNNVKLAATNALLNSLEFTKANFDKEVPRSPSALPVPTLESRCRSPGCK